MATSVRCPSFPGDDRLFQAFAGRRGTIENGAYSNAADAAAKVSSTAATTASKFGDRAASAATSAPAAGEAQLGRSEGRSTQVTVIDFVVVVVFLVHGERGWRTHLSFRRHRRRRRRGAEGIYVAAAGGGGHGAETLDAGTDSAAQCGRLFLLAEGGQIIAGGKFVAGPVVASGEEWKERGELKAISSDMEEDISKKESEKGRKQG